MMEVLQPILIHRDVPFNAADRQVMCYSHIVDLCSGCVIRNVGATDGNESSSGDETDSSDMSNCIALARSVVRVIRASGTRRDAFRDAIRTGNKKGYFKQGDPKEIVQVPELELLQDVKTRWDSVYHMLNRLRMLRLVSSACGKWCVLIDPSNRPSITSSPFLIIVTLPSTRSQMTTGTT
jgi:hypothetical protein